MSEYMENVEALIIARTAQLKGATEAIQILTKALNDIKAKADDADRARIEKAISEAEKARIPLA